MTWGATVPDRLKPNTYEGPSEWDKHNHVAQRPRNQGNEHGQRPNAHNVLTCSLAKDNPGV
ncbi:hypothetical protein A2U01_0075886, partial [Trifolium medium]|nr:hypothetical protein [Trifolium medium]